MQRATLMGTWPPAERHKQPDIYPLPARSIYFKGRKQTLSVNSCLLITGRGDVDFYIIIILCAFRYV